MRTELQQEIAQKLFDLQAKSKKDKNAFVRIEFVHAHMLRREDKQITSAFRQANGVGLLLVEPETDEDYENWKKAIDRAAVLLKEAEEEMIHALQTPNFFEAMQKQAMYNIIVGKDGKIIDVE